MTENVDTHEGNAGRVISDFTEEYNTPEAKKRREEAMNLADEIIHTTTGREISDLKNDMVFSCLRTDERLYKNYANSIKEHPEYQKYLQIYNYKGKSFLVIPLYDKSENGLIINTVEIGKDGGNLKIISDPYWLPDHPYAKESNVIPVAIEDESQQYGYHRVSMNKWTGEISDIDPVHYKMDEKGVNGLLDTIGNKAGKKISDCSEGLQNTLKDIVGKEDKLQQESQTFAEQKGKLVQCLINGDFSGAVNSFIDIVKSFLGKKKSGKITNLGEGLNYTGDEADFEYLEAAIDTVLDPEKRSKLTYLISKIKDERMKKSFKEKGIESPSQFDLFLQQLQPGQIMLTNGLKEGEGKGNMFDQAIQTVSGSRWCHALLISEVVKDSNGIITDAKIVQSTFKGGVHETTLKEYVTRRFSSADFILANLPDDKKDDVVKHAKNRVGEKYDTVSIVTDTIFGMDVDKGFASNGTFVDNVKSNLLGNNKAYCSELVFDAMEKSGLGLPEPHMSPSDLLTSDEITPQYACYCDKF